MEESVGHRIEQTKGKTQIHVLDSLWPALVRPETNSWFVSGSSYRKGQVRTAGTNSTNRVSLIIKVFLLHSIPLGFSLVFTAGNGIEWLSVTSFFYLLAMLLKTQTCLAKRLRRKWRNVTPCSGCNNKIKETSSRLLPVDLELDSQTKNNKIQLHDPREERTASIRPSVTEESEEGNRRMVLEAWECRTLSGCNIRKRRKGTKQPALVTHDSIRPALTREREGNRRLVEAWVVTAGRINVVQPVEKTRCYLLSLCFLLSPRLPDVLLLSFQ